MSQISSHAAPESNPPNWVSVAEASAALGVSARTIQKRIGRGEIEARRVPWEKGTRFEIEARTLNANQERTGSANKGERSPLNPQNHAQSSANEKGELKRESRANVRPSEGGELLETLRDSLAREREQIAFLRSTIEQLQREGAETRSALREALRAMPKALTSGAPDNGRPESARIPPESPQMAPMGNDGREASNGTPIAPEPAETGDFDLGEINDLIFQVFGGEK